MSTEKELANWIINKLTQAVYNSINNPSEDEFYFITDGDYYQTKLVSGTNIRTINSATILGAGNMEVANLSLANITLSGKNNAIKWFMPDYSAGVNILSSKKAPSNGYCNFQGSCSAGQYITVSVNNNIVGRVAGTGTTGNTSSLLFPVCKADIISFAGSANILSSSLTFYPCKGAN